MRAPIEPLGQRDACAAAVSGTLAFASASQTFLPLATASGPTDGDRPFTARPSQATYELSLIRPGKARQRLPANPDAMAIVDKSLFRPTPVPRLRRRKLLARVVLTQADGAQRAVVVENVSASGIQASCGEGAPPVGAQVTLALPGMAPLWGVVRWIQGRRFGIEIDPRGAAPNAEQDAPTSPPAGPPTLSD
ncbi:MAG: hypothetical protein IH997_05110 [Proteobacteria bacterium]|nr:hypothetical protein [Pseudomonadota bacterium]